MDKKLTVNLDGWSIAGCSIIYAPRGQAGEYAKLATNPYRGCGHKCAYCYVPKVLRMDRPTFDAGAFPRPNFIESVKGGNQPDVSYRGVESKDLVLSPEEAVQAILQYGFTEAYVEITNTSANEVRQAWNNFTPTLDEDEDED